MINTQIRLITFFVAKGGETLYSEQKQDLEPTMANYQLLIAKFRYKLKKVREITRPFRYDLNQIPYDYTVEVMNRFKGLDLVTSWEIDGETVETVSDFILGASKITADGDCSHEIKRRLLLGRKVVTNLDSILKHKDITLPTKIHLVKAMVFLWSCMDVSVGL